MPTIPAAPSPVMSGRPGVRAGLVARREMWAALAIASMWLAVLFDAVFGPDFVSTSAGGNSTTIPSGIFVAVFAYLGTRVVARYGFAPGDDARRAADDDRPAPG